MLKVDEDTLHLRCLQNYKSVEPKISVIHVEHSEHIMYQIHFIKTKLSNANYQMHLSNK